VDLRRWPVITTPGGFFGGSFCAAVALLVASVQAKKWGSTIPTILSKLMASPGGFEPLSPAWKKSVKKSIWMRILVRTRTIVLIGGDGIREECLYKFSIYDKKIFILFYIKRNLEQRTVTV
jgi:hypothetical protein